jgi:hypothetical protein
MATPVIRPWTPFTKDEKAFRATDASFQWLCDLPTELLRQYSGKWVAAKDCRIIVAADSLDLLLKELGEIDLETVVIDRIERPGWVVYR